MSHLLAEHQDGQEHRNGEEGERREAQQDLVGHRPRRSEGFRRTGSQVAGRIRIPPISPCELR